MQRCITITSSTVQAFYEQTILIAVSVLKISLPTMPMCFYVQSNDNLRVCFATRLMISDHLGMWMSFITLSRLLYEWGKRHIPHSTSASRWTDFFMNIQQLCYRAKNVSSND